jgi:hypothetical protein
MTFCVVIAFKNMQLFIWHNAEQNNVDHAKLYFVVGPVANSKGSFGTRNVKFCNSIDSKHKCDFVMKCYLLAGN